MSAESDSADIPGEATEKVVRTRGALEFRALFDAHADHVFRTLKRLGVRDPDVTDACQEVFVVVHRRLPDFDGTSTPKTWIYGICLRVASDYRRKMRRRREDVSAELPDAQVVATQEDTVDRRQLQARLDAVLERLDEPKRVVFVLYELEELSMTEIVKIVGCPLQTAYSRLHAARAFVKTAFRAADPREAPNDPK
jgi:RNA polymerase sigma-70 factor (ECF subfamily)